MEIKRYILLNPGPATTTDSVKMAQVVPDICPREEEFGALMEDVSAQLVEISGGGPDYRAILFAGSGTAGVDAAINSAVPAGKKILIINNGAYGKRMAQIAKAYAIGLVEIECSWVEPPSLATVAQVLDNDPNIATVAMIHHETTTGLLNPLKEIGELTRKSGRIFIVDAMSSFAGIPFSVEDCNIDLLVSSSDKCIQGMAGCTFVICRQAVLDKISTYPRRSFYLSLYDQYDHFIKTGQMQFTPPVQVLYALRKAIAEFLAEGAQNRYDRYLANWKCLIPGMKKLGFQKLLKDEYESHILTTFIEPDSPKYDFDIMHDMLYTRGFTIYPGKVGTLKTFRLANMGAIDVDDIESFLRNMKEVLQEMGVFSQHAL